MYSEGQNSIHSASGSRTDSYDHPSNMRLNGRPYQTRSSITEETPIDDNDYSEAVNDQEQTTKTQLPPPPEKSKQYEDAIKYRFPNLSRKDYSFPALPIPKATPAPPLPPSTQKTQSENQSQTSANQSGPYSSTIRPNITGGTSTSSTYEGQTLPKPVLRRVLPDQQNSYARSIAAELEAKEQAKTGTTTATTPATTPARANTSGLNVRINDPNNRTDQSTTSNYNRQPDSTAKTQLSIFEKVHSQSGPVSYLGTATFSQFEHCLQQCLERERQHTGIVSQIIREDIPATTSEFSYGHNPVSSSPYSRTTEPVRLHTFDDYPSRPTSTYTLDDIRHINVALSKSGIPLFPYHDYYTRSCSSPSSSRRYRTNGVVSACQIADDDPAILFSKNGALAVQNVWNAIRNCPGSYNY